MLTEVGVFQKNFIKVIAVVIIFDELLRIRIFFGKWLTNSGSIVLTWPVAS